MDPTEPWAFNAGSVGGLAALDPTLPWASIAGMAGGLLGLAIHGRRPATALISAGFAATGFAYHFLLGSSAVLAAIVGSGMGVAAARLASRDREPFPVGIFAWPLAGCLGAGAGLIHPLLAVPMGAAGAYLASHLDGRLATEKSRSKAAARLDVAAIIAFCLLALVPMIVGIGSTCGLGLLTYWPLIGRERIRSKLRAGRKLSPAPILMGVKSLAAWVVSAAGLLVFWILMAWTRYGSEQQPAGWLEVVWLIAGQGALLGGFASIGTFRLRQAGFFEPGQEALPEQPAELNTTA